MLMRSLRMPVTPRRALLELAPHLTSLPLVIFVPSCRTNVYDLYTFAGLSDMLPSDKQYLPMRDVQSRSIVAYNA